MVQIFLDRCNFQICLSIINYNPHQNTTDSYHFSNGYFFFKKEIKKELEKTGYVDTDNVVKKKKGRPRKNECAEENRKEISNDELKEGYDLNITGVRKAEGGVRATAYKSCFDITDKGYDNYRPIFWFKDNDKLEYRKLFNVSHSKCYSIYGLKRTGCCGCPYGKDNSFELKVLEEHEPKLYKAVTNIFKDSYEYTKLYQEFKNK